MQQQTNNCENTQQSHVQLQQMERTTITTTRKTTTNNFHNNINTYNNYNNQIPTISSSKSYNNEKLSLFVVWNSNLYNNSTKSTSPYPNPLSQTQKSLKYSLFSFSPTSMEVKFHSQTSFYVNTIIEMKISSLRGEIFEQKNLEIVLFSNLVEKSLFDRLKFQLKFL